MNKAYAVMTIELVIIAVLGFCSYRFYSVASNSVTSNSDGPLTTSFREPPPLTTEINDTTSLMNDLESLGCKVFYITDEDGWRGVSPLPQLLNYTDFRRIAYNTGIVFFWSDLPYGVEIYSTINGIPVEADINFQQS